MALIQCIECNNEVSDAAASCPKCGAPVPRTLAADQEACPFCMTAVHESATICPGCRARKGYTHAQGVIYGKFQTWLFGVIVPGIIALIAFGTFTGIGFLVGLVFLIPVVLCGLRLKNGPVWFQTTGIN